MVVAAVEGEEVGLLAVKPGGHPHFVRVYRKMDEGTLLEGEEKIPPVPLLLVLAHRIGCPLSC